MEKAYVRKLFVNYSWLSVRFVQSFVWEFDLKSAGRKNIVCYLECLLRRLFLPSFIDPSKKTISIHTINLLPYHFELFHPIMFFEPLNFQLTASSCVLIYFKRLYLRTLSFVDTVLYIYLIKLNRYCVILALNVQRNNRFWSISGTVVLPRRMSKWNSFFIDAFATTFRESFANCKIIEKWKR